MLKVVLICGGTGGIAIQRGFAELYGYRNYRLDVVINAYDNGKSTGVCRKVFGGRILGPSDLRKNQLTQFRLAYADRIKDQDSYEAKLLSLFELRLSANDYEGYFEAASDIIENIDYLEEKTKEAFRSWLSNFFFADTDAREFREAVKIVDFHDFSLSNIFYASCAAMHGDSLAAAGKEMARILCIEDRVHLISDESLFLKARTASGYVIEDEGDIICWNKPEDKIIEAVLVDGAGNTRMPKIDGKDQEELGDIFRQADLLLFSSGTQWSSLIPTYMHQGFKDLVQSSRAKKYLVMNNIEDGDMKGVGADELLSTVEKFLDLSDTTIVVNKNAVPSMRRVGSRHHALYSSLSGVGDSKHIPKVIVAAIMADYYHLGLAPRLISDLDGTLWNEKDIGCTKEVGIENLRLFEGTILSGNNYDHVYDVAMKYFENHRGGNLYCDYGNTCFCLCDPKGTTERLSDEYDVDSALVDELQKEPDFKGKVTLRGGIIITIKPLDCREEKLRKVNALIGKFGGEYQAVLAGRTSIDIFKKGFSKAEMLKRIIQKEGLDAQDVIYTGNELIHGNEECIQKMPIRTLQINDVFDMNVFLKTYRFQTHWGE